MKIKIDCIVPEFDGIHYTVVLNKPYTVKSFFKRNRRVIKSCHGIYGTDNWVDQDFNPLPSKLSKFISYIVVKNRIESIANTDFHRLNKKPNSKTNKNDTTKKLMSNAVSSLWTTKTLGP